MRPSGRRRGDEELRVSGYIVNQPRCLCFGFIINVIINSFIRRSIQKFKVIVFPSRLRLRSLQDLICYMFLVSTKEPRKEGRKEGRVVEVTEVT